ncbi:MAG: stage II sporulation protein P [Anaerovorax sp.]
MRRRPNNRKKGSIVVVGITVCLFTSFMTLQSMSGEKPLDFQKKSAVESMAILCLESVFPMASRGFDREKVTVATADTNPKEYEEFEKMAEQPAPPVAQANDANPQVLIYHTHATESYQPVSYGNFHTVEEYGTVREVGDMMAEGLRARGIGVVHDKTLHDSPSYNQSYDRSLQTAKGLLAKYPSGKIIIDLHRDAAAYTGGAGKTVKIKGQDVAKYSLVVGNGNENVAELKAFAAKVNEKAESLYPGFGGKIIEKEYKYNEYISNQALLVEAGNNQNTIDQTKLTGKYLAEVFAEVLKEM